MASFDLIRLPDGTTQSCVNIKKPVGHGGANLREDVLLIQVLFNYIAEGLSPSAIGLGGEYPVPEMNGIMDAETYSAIGAFQLRNLSALLISRFDGRIDPASYRNRRINLVGKRLMSITYLHLIAPDAAVMRGTGGDYTTHLAHMNPELATYLDRSLIESL